MKQTIFLFLLLTGIQCIGQDIDYARKIIKDLCAPNMHGRGYEKKADKIAANYLLKEIKHIGLKAFNDNYLQEFTINVNTFPSKVDVKYNNQSLRCGTDYLVRSYSISYKGKAKLISLKKLLLSPEAKKELDTDYLLLLDAGKEYTTQTVIENIDKIASNLICFKGFVSLTEKLGAHYQSTFSLPFVELNMIDSLSLKHGDYLNIDIKNKFLDNYKTNNIIAYIPGKIDSFVVLTAHYDHIGQLGGKVYFPGAHDNASGTALVLDLARHYAQNKPKYSIAIILFSAEEIGLLGSRYYCSNPLFEHSKTKFLINLDLVGSGEEGIKIVNGSVHKKHFDKLVQLNEANKLLTKIEARGAAKNSDHYYFHEKGVKCFFIYTLGQYKEYHNIHDTSETVPMPAYDDLFVLLKKFINSF